MTDKKTKPGTCRLCYNPAPHERTLCYLCLEDIANDRALVIESFETDVKTLEEKIKDLENEIAQGNFFPKDNQ